MVRCVYFCGHSSIWPTHSSAIPPNWPTCKSAIFESRKTVHFPENTIPDFVPLQGYISRVLLRADGVQGYVDAPLRRRVN